MFNLQCNFHDKSSLQMQLYFYISTGNDLFDPITSDLESVY